MANVLESDNISGTGWAANANAVVTANHANAPDGTQTASRLIDNAATGTGNVQVANTITALSLSTAHIYHGFLKSDQLAQARLQIGGLGTLDLFVLVDMTSGVISAAGADVADSGIESYQDGWYWAWFTFTSDASDGIGSAIVRAGNLTQDLDGTSSILAAGVLLEEGLVATPAYSLPTSGSRKAGMGFGFGRFGFL